LNTSIWSTASSPVVGSSSSAMALSPPAVAPPLARLGLGLGGAMEPITEAGIIAPGLAALMGMAAIAASAGASAAGAATIAPA
jgi:hypothetical protein